MVEKNDLAEDSTAYYATHQESCVRPSPTYLSDKFLQRSGLTWQTGEAGNCRGMFAMNGSLNNSRYTSFRAVNEYARLLRISCITDFEFPSVDGRRFPLLLTWDQLPPIINLHLLFGRWALYETPWLIMPLR
jgi:hypothetical protein